MILTGWDCLNQLFSTGVASDVDIYLSIILDINLTQNQIC